MRPYQWEPIPQPNPEPRRWRYMLLLLAPYALFATLDVLGY